uniref:Neuregulin 2 n=1 Tax=Buteo japonicus TaxID=224669 RepID=A0A8C0C2S4_9AVES
MQGKIVSEERELLHPWLWPGGRAGRRQISHCLVSLFIAVPPKLKKLKSPNVHVGEKISLKCEATAGNPQPSYKWFKDGKELKKSKDIRIKKISRLQFNKVKLEDAGEYSCEAENVLGKDTAKGSLNVKSVTTTLSSWSGHARKCNETAKSYCVNGGVCYYIEGINQLSSVHYSVPLCGNLWVVYFSASNVKTCKKPQGDILSYP